MSEMKTDAAAPMTWGEFKRAVDAAGYSDSAIMIRVDDLYMDSGQRPALELEVHRGEGDVTYVSMSPRQVPEEEDLRSPEERVGLGYGYKIGVTSLEILRAAAARPDGAVLPLPEHIGGAPGALLTALETLGLILRRHEKPFLTARGETLVKGYEGR